MASLKDNQSLNKIIEGFASATRVKCRACYIAVFFKNFRSKKRNIVTRNRNSFIYNQYYRTICFISYELINNNFIVMAKYCSINDYIIIIPYNTNKVSFYYLKYLIIIYKKFIFSISYFILIVNLFTFIVSSINDT